MNIANIRATAAAAAAIALAGLAVPAAAANPAATRTNQQAATSARTAGQAQRVCVRTEFTGSRVARNVCRTQAEWERAGGVPRAD